MYSDVCRTWLSTMPGHRRHRPIWGVVSVRLVFRSCFEGIFVNHTAEAGQRTGTEGVFDQ